MQWTKRLLLLLLALCMLCPVAASAEITNWLYNGDFEELDSDGLPDGWFTDAYRNREGITLYSTTNEGRTGNAIVVENLGLNDARFGQMLTVEPNSIYRLSGYIRADGILDTGRGANLSVSDVYVFSESIFDTAGEWQYVEMYGITGEDQHNLTVYARVGGYSGESIGQASFDDLALTKVDSVPDGVVADRWYAQPAPQVIPAADNTDTAKEASPAWPMLLAIAVAYAAAALWLMRHTQLDAREEALREAARRHGKHPLGMPAFAMVGIFLAAAARILVALNVTGYEVDVNCFTAWGNTMANVGPAEFYQSNWCDYTPGYIYVMGFNALLARVLSPWVSTAFVHKLIPMACDLVGAWLVYRIATENHYSRKQAGILAVMMAFNPAIFLNSAAWCQVDSVLCLGLMAVAYFAMHRQWKLVLPLYVLCALVKPQALMLGFLGLAAIIMEIVNEKNPNAQRRIIRDMLIGVGISAALALLVVLPFSPNQENAFWLFNLYGDTLASYPYVTVNTANYYYLFSANWVGIDQPANVFAIVVLAAMTLGWAVWNFLRRDKSASFSLLEPILLAAFALVFAVMMLGDSWKAVGVVAMVLAFAVVLPIYIRGGKLENLPLCGAVLFLLLYVFGIKMHERYLFPALFLLGMAYGIRRDRRILGLLIATSCALFLNEGIVLDNAVRLGAAQGHLNADTTVLAMLLSLINVACALVSVWVCRRVCMEDAPVRLSEGVGEPLLPVREHESAPCTPLTYKPNVAVRWTRLDLLLMAAVTAIYAVVTLTTLGSTKAPQQPWKSSTYEEYAVIDLGKHYDDFSMLYFCEVSYDNFQVATSDDAEAWSEPYWAEMAEGQCFRWKYIVPSYESGGRVNFTSPNSFAGVQKMSGQYVKIIPQQIGLIVNEVIFKDAQGNIIPATVVGAMNGNTNSPLYSDPANLLNEQDTLEGEPGWWNSTYFDEIYHARTAFEHLNGTMPYETSHPPLGKVIMSWFVALFGMTPFGWRFAGALCGILMLPAMYLLAKQMTKRTAMGFAAMTMMALDCMHLTQTRIATIDSFPVLFIILSYFFMLRFMQRDIIRDDLKRVLPDLALSGFFMGCGFASKWIGAYAGVGLAVLFFWTCLRHLRMGLEASRMLREGKSFIKEQYETLVSRDKPAMRRVVVLCLWCLLFFVVVPLAIYLLSYIPYYAYRKFGSLSEFLAQVWRSQESMLSYHGEPGRGMDHPFYSPWYEWPFMKRPMYYAMAAFVPEGWSYAIFCFGNPAVWFVGLGGIAFAVYRWAYGHRYRITGKEGTFQLYSDSWNVAPAFVLIGLLAQFLPWLLVPRGTYIYHYFASVPFLILGTTLLLHYIWKEWPKAGKWVTAVYLMVCLLFFVLLFPHASGVLTPTWWLDLVRNMKFLNVWY